MFNWLFIFALFVATTLPAQAAELNAGFVEGLWYSSPTVFVDQPVRIYAAVRNNTGEDLTGVVEFFINESRIERTNVQALDGRIIEAWADWTPVYGTSSVSATLTHTRLSPVGETTETVSLTAIEARDIIFVDYDTDGDGVGNQLDQDDDGDSIPDSEDAEPLVPQKLEKSDESQGKTAEPAVETTRINSSSTEPEGLEQYLTPSRADTLLGSITETINSTKAKVDALREERRTLHNETITDTTNQNESTETAAADSTSTEATFSENGFGTPERSQTNKVGFLTTIQTVLAGAWQGLVTFILFVLSLYLGHPAFVQLTLLILIVFIIFKLARRLAARPSS